MTGELWLYAALLAFAALQLVAVGHAALGDRERPVATGSDDGRAGGDADSVVCPDCEAVNERDYRFCRQCVAELPGAGRQVVRKAPTRNGNVF